MKSVVAGLLLTGAAMPAYAQTSSPQESTVLEEIVVTGTRQDTRLADTPVAVTVLSEDFIRDARIESVRDIDDYVPNVQFNCGSAWKRDPGSGVIGVEKGPLIPVV